MADFRLDYITTILEASKRHILHGCVGYSYVTQMTEELLRL